MKSLALLWATISCLSLSTFAQTRDSAITGTLRGADGAPLKVVPVKVTSLEAGAISEAATNELGIFRVGALAPGSYSFQAELPEAHLDFRFEIAQAGQVIDVGSLVLRAAPQAPAPAADPPAAAAEGGAQPIQPVYEQITVSARRIDEEVQSVPIPLSVMSGAEIEKAGAFNVNRLKELIPTVQFYSSNPRNTAINIRGLGSPFGLTNDGIEPGVGFYVDGVFFARPAAATLDFLDLERIEVLRGPQGTLFGKNTTAGAISVTTRKPSFTPETNFELSYGNLGFIQAKGSISGPFGKKVAGRLSFAGTQRDGMLHNVRTGDDVNDLNNQGVRGQLMFVASDKLSIMATADYSRQRPRGYAQVVAGVAPTLRPANRQYGQIAADLGYTPPSFNAFDRLIDTDTPWRSSQELGGASLTLDWKRGPGVLTAITAWRYWDWKPSNDRDFIGLPVTTVSAAPSRQTQWTQEVRYAGNLSSQVNFLVGAFAFQQSLKPSPFHKQEQGSAAARFLLAPSANASTPGLLDGYGQNIDFDFNNVSSAAFGQFEYAVTNRLRLIPGLRLNYDQKKLDYDQQVYGGLQTTNTALIALQRSVLSPLTYQTNVADTNLSGQLTTAYSVADTANVYATYATGFKSVGLNLGGVPTDAANQPVLSAATVRPEGVRHLEIGLKSRPLPGVTANITAFNTAIKDLQTQVVNAQVGVLRGYLANAQKARVRGVEFDGNAKVSDDVTLYGAVAHTDGRYTSFADAPPPLEDTGGPQVKDISGSVLPGISKWAASFGGEYARPGRLLGRYGEFFARVDASYRSQFSSSPSASRYLVVDGYPLLNTRAGFRSQDGWAIAVWTRNLTNRNYFEFLSAAPGNSGLYVGLPGDRRTFGVTLSRTFTERDSAPQTTTPARPRSQGK
jgi:iron complex outermembrane recepter protein